MSNQQRFLVEENGNLIGKFHIRQDAIDFCNRLHKSAKLSYHRAVEITPEAKYIVFHELNAGDDV
uniref:Uncharacterized protein n=1 Tax=viral metagenome TaxID=1070528 RepID=A0A6M3KIR0_9ZZZZ